MNSHFCLVFTATEKWRVELRAKTGHYRNRCFKRSYYMHKLKGKRNAYFDFKNVGFILSTNCVLLTAIYTHLRYTDNKFPQQISLIFADDTFHLRLCHSHVQAQTDYTWRKPELENKSFSKKMDRWKICRLTVVSLITNNDNSWSTFPIYKRFRWQE